MELVSLFLATALADNICLAHFAGVNEALENEESIGTVGLALTVSTVVAGLLTNVLNPLISSEALTFLHIPAFVLVCVVVGLVVNKVFASKLENKAVSHLIVLNTVVLLSCVQTASLPLVEALVKSLAAGAGVTIAMYLIKGIDGRIQDKHIPAAFRGMPIRFVALAIMALCAFAF